MTRARLRIVLLNAGHFVDHLVMLVFATVAAMTLTREWGMSYGALLPYATPGFIAFGLFSLPAGWLADRWSRDGMIAVFFAGVGLASMLTAFARTPEELAAGLFLVGIFAAIYHPVGLALIYESAPKAGNAIAVNGVWGNLGVASAALITGYFLDHGGWRAAFFVPGMVSLALAALYAWAVSFRAPFGGSAGARAAAAVRATPGTPHPSPVVTQRATDAGALLRITAVVFFTTATAGLIFQSTTFALPKVFAERLGGIGSSATLLGWLAFWVFAIASLAQLVVGRLLDRIGPRPVLMGICAIQALFFALMPGRADWAALTVALGFMLGSFGQNPINDFMIGRMATPERRASIYGIRFVVTFAALGGALPLVSWIHAQWGFDTLFRLLSVAAIAMLASAVVLPARLPEPSTAPRTA
jgi:MFS family permease